MSHHTLLHRGVPIGTVDLRFDHDLCGGTLTPRPAFDAIRGAIADASRALTNLGFLPPVAGTVGAVDADGDRVGAAAFREATETCALLELRDASGALRATEWIEVFGGRTDDERVDVMAAVGSAPSGIPAKRLPPRRADGGESSAG